MRTPWTVIINTWPYSADEIERAIAPLSGWADNIILAELGTWHRSLTALTSLGRNIGISEWMGSFCRQHDFLMRQERRNGTERVLFLEGNEIIRRMDLHHLEDLSSGDETAYWLNIESVAPDAGKKEIRILKPVGWHGFAGLYKPDPYPGLAAFCQDIRDTDVSLFPAQEQGETKAAQMEQILSQNLMPPLIKARWLIEMRKFVEGSRVLRKEAWPHIDKDQDFVTWKMLMAETLLGLSKPLAALQMLAPLMAASPTCDRGYLMGLVLYELNRYEEASTYFFQSGTGMLGDREYQAPGADGYRSLLWAAECLNLAKRPKDSFEVLKRLLEDYPLFQEAWTFFFRLFAGAQPQELYEILTQFMSGGNIYDVFEHLKGLEEEGKRFRQWILR